MRRRTTVACGLALMLSACSPPAPAPAPAAEPAAPPADSQHAGITEPHGDHTAHHGGMVLMNGDVHYEVVMSPDGSYALWFSDAVRELPASIARNVRVEVTRPDGPVETLTLAIDDSGESWVGKGKPLSDNTIVKVTYDLMGVPSEVEIPYVPARPTS
ncbi:MAG: hypothetical protein R2712_26585 [Vicinamibacterales bacterium]